jgi:hypothetical protein
MKAWIAAVALVGALGSGGAVAQAMTYGVGTAGCGEYVSAAEATRIGNVSAIQPYLHWLSGFVSYASSQSGVDYFKGQKTPNVQLWLENYCRAHPLEQFSMSALNLLLELSKKSQ